MSDTALRVFISYSHKDREMKEDLEIFLFQLKDSKYIDVWQDGELTAGEEFNAEISEALQHADIILLLVSQYFIVSPFIRQEELSVAMDRHEQGKARVIPIILKPCNWHGQPYGKLVALPRDGKPVVEYESKDAVYTAIALELERVVNNIVSKR